ncbi:MAG: hypothetical protein JWR83_993 [Aeromicrobium sp.]|nr:hypothetical protein [Aeromicrobium sp.]
MDTRPKVGLTKFDWSQSAKFTAKSSRKGAPSVVGTAPTLSTFEFANNQVIYDPDASPIFGNIAVTAGDAVPPFDLTTHVKYYGVDKGLVPLFEGTVTSEPFGGAPIPDNWGPGLYSFGPTTIDDGTTQFVDSQVSTPIRVRNATQGDNLYIKYVGSRKHKVNAFLQVYRPSANAFAGGIPSVRLQYKSGSTWKPFKTIKLNKYGKASYVWYTSTKRSYRILVPTTLSIQGGSDVDQNGKGIYF